MSDADNDPVIHRAIEELRRLPAVDPRAMRRVIDAAATARVSPADEPTLMTVSRGGGVRLVRVWSTIGIAAAAIIGFLARGVWMPIAEHSAANGARGVASAGASSMVEARASAVMAIPQQFVLESRTAHRIAVVGDFNKWNPNSAPMTRSAEGSLWSAVIPVLPGRHVYGFMIDDSLFVLDPRQPKARDPDLGTEGSVVIVGRP